MDSTFAEDSDTTPRQARHIPLRSETRRPRRSFLGMGTATMDSPRRRRRDAKNNRGDGNGKRKEGGRGIRGGKRSEGGGLQDCLDGMESTTEGLTDLERRVQAMRIWGGIEEERKEFLMQEIRKWDGRG